LKSLHTFVLADSWATI